LVFLFLLVVQKQKNRGRQKEAGDRMEPMPTGRTIRHSEALAAMFCEFTGDEICFPPQCGLY